jgi:hypothetical protein
MALFKSNEERRIERDIKIRQGPVERPINASDAYRVNVHEVSPGIVYKDSNVTVNSPETLRALDDLVQVGPVLDPLPAGTVGHGGSCPYATAEVPGRVKKQSSARTAPIRQATPISVR